MRVLVALAIAVGAVGCFNPTYNNPECSPQGDCPDGLVCGPDNICRASADPIDAAELDAMIDAPDGMPADANLAFCDVREPATCPDGWRCAPVMGAGGEIEPHCVPDGEVPIGGFCEPWLIKEEVTGYRHDDCLGASMCIGNECRAFCQIGSSCEGPYACVGYGILPNDPELGVCDPTCDPVTQVRNTDGAGWCNSTNIAQPERTCVGQTNGPFFCAPTQDVNATHGFVPSPAYLNSCAAGYMPFGQDVAGNPMCVAMCSPAPTSMLNQANAGGQPGSGYTCTDRGADTAECRYIHILQDPGQPGYGLYNNVGFCFDYQISGAPSCTTSTENDTGNGCWPI